MIDWIECELNMGWIDVGKYWPISVVLLRLALVIVWEKRDLVFITISWHSVKFKVVTIEMRCLVGNGLVIVISFLFLVGEIIWNVNWKCRITDSGDVWNCDLFNRMMSVMGFGLIEGIVRGYCLIWVNFSGIESRIELNLY